MAYNNADIELLAGLNLQSSEAEILKAIKILQKNLSVNEQAKIKLDVAMDQEKLQQILTTLQELAKRSDLSTSTQKTINSFNKEAAEMTSVARAAQQVTQQKKEIVSANEEIVKTSKSMKGSNANIQQMVSDLHNMNNTGQKTNSVFGNIKDAISNTFSSGKLAMTSYLAVLKSINTATREAKEAIKELNGAETDLMIATGMNRESIKGLIQDYNAYAKELKSSTTDVTSAADDYLRAGKTLEESQRLIKDSIMLSKLGQIESSEATNDLLATMNGYNMSTDEVDRALDAMVAIDMEAATSAGDLATGLKYSASSASSAGVEFNKLLAILGTVQDKTQQSAETVGTFANTMLSRYRDITIGKYLTDDGEDISNYESVFASIGIQLRDSQGEFRSFESVLEEMVSKWDSLTSVQQNALIKVAAGTRQQNRFIALMENYNKVLDLTEVAVNSAGVAVEKFNSSYATSLEARQNTLQASFESMIYNTDLDEVYGDILDATTAVVEFIDKANLLKGVMTGLTVGAGIKGFLALTTGIHQAYIQLNQFQGALNILKKTSISNKDFKSLLLLTNNLSESQTNLILSSKSLTLKQKEQILVAQGLGSEEAKLRLQTLGVTSSQTGLTASTTSLRGALQGLWTTIKANPMFLIVTGVSIAASAFSSYKNKVEEVRQATENAATAYQESLKSIDDFVSKYQDLQTALQQARGNEEETATVKQQLLELQTELNDKYGEEYGKLNLVTDAYKDQTEAIRNLNKEEANKFLNENRKGISTATNKMEKEQSYVISASTLSVDTPDGKALQEIVNSYAEDGMKLITDGATGAVQIVLTADAQTAYDTLNNFETDLRNKAKELGNEHLFDNILDVSSTSLKEAKSIVDKYGSIYTQALMAKLVTDDNASGTYYKALEAVEEYNNAVANSEDIFSDEKVLAARENLETVKEEFSNNEALTQFATLFNNIFEQAETKMIDFYNRLQNDADLQEWAEALRGKEVVDLESMIDDGVEDAFDKLAKSAEEYGLSVDEIVDSLIRLGYVQGEVTGEDAYNVNTVSFDTLSDQIDSIQSAYKSLSTAVEEYNQHGYVTADTLQSILALDSQYLACLIDENGQLAINGSTYQNLVQAKLADAEATAVQQAIEELGKVTTEDQIDADVTAIGVMAEKGTALAALSGQYAALANVAVSAATAQALADGYTKASSTNKEEADKIMSNLNAKLALIQSTADKTSSSFGALTNHLNGFTDSNKKATEALKKQKEALQDELDELDNLYDAINWFYDKKIEKIDDSIDAINDEIDALEKQKDNLDDIIEAIERNYDYEISKIQEKIDVIKDENDEQERALKLEEAKRKLLEAKSRKSVQVYSKGIGFTYQVDSSAIKESQDELDDLQDDAVIAELEKEIEKLEEAKKLWSEIPDAYNQAMQDIAASKYFGSDWKNLTLFPSDELLNNFKGNYMGIQGSIDSKNNQIDALEKQKAQIEELKSLWEDAKNSYRDSQYEARLSAFFGSDYDYQLLNNSASWRRKFADEYASISKQIEDIENQLKLANEETASSVESVGTAVENTKSKLEGTGNVSKYLWTTEDDIALEHAKERLDVLNQLVDTGSAGYIGARDNLAAFINEYQGLHDTGVVTDELRAHTADLTDEYSTLYGLVGTIGSGLTDRLSDASRYSNETIDAAKITADELTKINEQINNLKTSEDEIKEEAAVTVLDMDTVITNLSTKLATLQTALSNVKTFTDETEQIVNEEVVDTDSIVDEIGGKITTIQEVITTLSAAIAPLSQELNNLLTTLGTLDDVTLSNVIGAFGGASGSLEANGSQGTSAQSKGSKDGSSEGGTGLLGAVKAVDEAIGSEENVESLLGRLKAVNDSDLTTIINSFGLGGENDSVNLLNAVNAVSKAVLGDDDEVSLVSNIGILGSEKTTSHIGTVTTSFDGLLKKINEAISAVESLSEKIANMPSVGDIGGYATGTRNAKEGLHKLSENGTEIVTDGRSAVIATEPTLMNMKGGETVYNASETEKILEGASEIEPFDNPLRLSKADYEELLAQHGLVPYTFPDDIFIDNNSQLRNMNFSGNGFPELIVPQFNLPSIDLSKLEDINRNAQTTVQINGDLSFPNIRSGNDAEKLIQELSNLSNKAMQRASRRR